MASNLIPHIAKLVTCVMAVAALSACSAQPYDSDRTAAALMILGGGMQNYGTARASYQPAYQSTFCYPVGRGMSCQ